MLDVVGYEGLERRVALARRDRHEGGGERLYERGPSCGELDEGHENVPLDGDVAGVYDDLPETATTSETSRIGEGVYGVRTGGSTRYLQWRGAKRRRSNVTKSPPRFDRRLSTTDKAQH